MCCTRTGNADMTQTQAVFLHNLPEIHIDALQCAQTQRVYVGQTSDLTARFAQHKRNPPSRMKADAQHWQPLEAHFKMIDLGIVLETLKLIVLKTQIAVSRLRL